MNVFGLIVGIPAALLLTGIISVLITLLVTYHCFTRGKSQKSGTPSEAEPLFKSEDSDLSDKFSLPAQKHDLSCKSTPLTQEDPVYDYIPVSGIRAIETSMKNNVAYGSSPAVNDDDDDNNDNNYD